MTRLIVTVFTIILFCGLGYAVEPDSTYCIAPAGKGGGLDLTCRLAAETLTETGLIDSEMSVKNMPGGVGALAYNYTAKMRRDVGNTIIAASAGSILNIAQGKFGRYTETDARWLGAIAVDYGTVVVRSDSPWQNLNDLIADLKKNPQEIVFGGGGSVGSQDWVKTAMLAEAAKVESKRLRYVSYEGGGEALIALRNRFIDVLPGDISEIIEFKESSDFRILASLSEYRLNGKFSDIPTAKEQGYDIVWPIWRGFYMSPNSSDADYNWWVNTLRRLVKSDIFRDKLEQRGLNPFYIFGKDFQQYVKNQFKLYNRIAIKEGLVD
jgi:putative tricarboxylic transport membrane protein